jgi:antitoxin (DNA-binding transcriptional repressor) of toxin-antitoxin stability system
MLLLCAFVTQKYGIPFRELPAHCQDAVDAAESARSRTLVTRDGRPVAAIVPMTDLDRIDPPDPGAGGVDPLLTLCGACRHDAFVDALVDDAGATTLWRTSPFAAGIADDPSRS